MDTAPTRRPAPPARVLLACLGLPVLAWVYCLPQHPAAMASSWLDVALHAGLFMLVAIAFAHRVSAGRGAFAGLVLLAGGLEVLQWWRGGYAWVEMGDISANVAGVCVGWVVHRWRADVERARAPAS